jgi:hypothetical protein
VRRATLLASFAITVALIGAAVVWALDAGGVPYRVGDVDRVARMDGRLRAIAAIGDPHKIVFLGDSLSMDFTPPDTSVPQKIALALEGRLGGVTGLLGVHRIVDTGLGLFSHYFMSARVVEAKPVLVILEVNPGTFCAPCLRRENRKLAALLPVGQWSEAARLPLHGIGLSVDRLLFWRGILLAGGLRAWLWLQREQVRVARAYWSAAEWLQDRSGHPSGMDFRKRHSTVQRFTDLQRASLPGSHGLRSTAQLARTRFGVLMDGLDDGNPGVRAFEALLARYQGAGIPVVAYAAPISVEHLESVGVYDRQGAASSMKRLEAIAHLHGASWIDLHDLLPDVAFRDYMDHLDYTSPMEPSRRVAERIAPLVIERWEPGEGHAR